MSFIGFYFFIKSSNWFNKGTNELRIRIIREIVIKLIIQVN